jgi:Kef-type K+ transport system membrane component KefB
LSLEALLLSLGLGLISARFLGELFEKAGLPSVIGEIIAGIILGPTLLNIVQPSTIEEFSQIGIIFLLFIIGLEIDFKEMKKISNKAIVITGIGISISFAGGMIGGYIFGLSAFDWRAPIFIGLAFMATSVGITVKTLYDMDKLNTDEGKTVLSVAIYDDVITLIALTIISASIGETVGFTDISALLPLVSVGIFFAVMIFVVPILIKVIPRFTKTAIGAEVILSVAAGLILIIAFISESIGLSAILGSFLLGLAFRNIPEIQKTVHDKVESVTNGVFLPIFFFYIGVLTIITPDLLSFTTLGLILLAISGKFIGHFLGAKILRLKNRESAVIGVGMIPRAEVLLAITEIAIGLGIFISQIRTIMVLIVIITSLITPLLLKLLYKKEQPKLEACELPERAPIEPEEIIIEEKKKEIKKEFKEI